MRLRTRFVDFSTDFTGIRKADTEEEPYTKRAYEKKNMILSLFRKQNITVVSLGGKLR